MLSRLIEMIETNAGSVADEMLQKTYGFETPLSDPERLAEAIEEKRKREEAIYEEPKLLTLCFTKGMTRFG